MSLRGRHGQELGGTAWVLLRLLLPERSDKTRCVPDTANRREPLETWRRQVLHHIGLGFCLLAGPSAEEGQEKTGFAFELGLYQWEKMPFGLCNATATFQRRMAQALTRVTKKYENLVMCYLDDVVIAKSTLEDHIDWLDEIFGCMKRAGFKSNHRNVKSLGIQSSIWEEWWTGMA